MKKYIPLVLGIVLMITAIVGGKILYDKIQLGNLTDQLNEELMEANLKIGKAETKFGNAQKYISELESELADTIKSKNETLTRYGELEAVYKASMHNSGTGIIDIPDEVEPLELCKEFEPGRWYVASAKDKLFTFNGTTFKHSDFRLDITCKAYSTGDWRKIDTNIDYTLHLKLKAQLVETTTKTGAVNYYVNIFELNDKGETVGKFDITQFEMIVDNQDEATWFWWAPHVDVGLFAGLNKSLAFSGGGTAGFSVMGYGLTKNDLYMKVLRLGVDFDGKGIGMSVSPAMWNAGSVLPLVSNVWLSPYVGLDFTGFRSAGLQLTVGL